MNRLLCLSILSMLTFACDEATFKGRTTDAGAVENSQAPTYVETEKSSIDGGLAVNRFANF